MDNSRKMVARNVWKYIKGLGISGVEENNVYEDSIHGMELRDQEGKSSLEENQQNGP